MDEVDVAIFYSRIIESRIRVERSEKGARRHSHFSMLLEWREQKFRNISHRHVPPAPA